MAFILRGLEDSRMDARFYVGPTIGKRVSRYSEGIWLGYAGFNGKSGMHGACFTPL